MKASRLFAAYCVSAVIILAPPCSSTGKAGTVATGSTEKEVRQALGAPRGTMKQGNGALWLYDDTEVTFRNGKVTAVHQVAARPVPAPPAPVAPQAPVATPAPAAPAAPQPQAAPTQAPAQSQQPPANATPPQEVIIQAASGLKDSWNSPNNEGQSRISCTFGLPRLSAEALEAQKTKGMIPFRVTATIHARTDADAPDKWTLVRSGPCNLRIFDERGSEIVSTTIQADKLCPS